ncbi:hypothetical protein [Mesorhizobium sp. 128a]
MTAPSATHLPTETGTRHTLNYAVHYQRNPFYDPDLPPFWELTVENSGCSYRVMIGVAADKFELAMQNLPEPSAERHGVDFIRAYKEVILPEDIRRLSGETMMAFLIYKVKFAPRAVLQRRRSCSPDHPNRGGPRRQRQAQGRPATKV